MRCEVPQLLFLADGVPIKEPSTKNGDVSKSRQNEHRWCAETVGLVVKKSQVQRTESFRSPAKISTGGVLKRSG